MFKFNLWILNIIMVLGLFVADASALVTYSDPTAFSNDVQTQFLWDFEDLTPNGALIQNVPGPGGVNMVQARATAGSAFDNSVSVSGNLVYFNAQAANGDFTFLDGPAYNLGLSVTWSHLFNPNGIEATIYDINDTSIGSLFLNSSLAINQYASQSGSTMYDGFFGFNSDVAIGRIKVTQQQPGATYYDNLIFGSSTSVIPEPATMLLFGTGLLGVALKRRFYA